jgi:dTDP-4-amino-4,6-dideoxygalactose transaminase
MRREFLSFSPPSIGPEEIEEVVETLKTDWITTGPKTRRFEEDFGTFVGVSAALAVSSATDAMLVALAALGASAGDEVITTPMTFCSTVHVIEHMGARPVLVDVEPDTLCIDPERVAAAVTSRTKGILPVHLYGHPCDMEALLKIAESHGLFVLEDAAHSLPARYKGRMIGAPAHSAQRTEINSQQRDSSQKSEVSDQSQDRGQKPVGSRQEAGGPGPGQVESGPPVSPVPLVANSSSRSAIRNLTAFSFYATKNMTTAEGGMLTGDPELIDKARVWSLHGMSRDAYKRYTSEGSWFYEVVVPGFKCNMTDIQASLGLQQLKKLPAFQARRREIVRRYTEAFSQIPELQLPVERPDVESAWHIYTIRLNLEMLHIDRGRFIEEMKSRNIGTSVHFIPIHLHPYYRDKYGFKPQDFPVAYREYQRLVSLLSPHDRPGRDRCDRIRRGHRQAVWAMNAGMRNSGKGECRL